MPELSLRYCDLSQARVLITNDDGIHAPGIAVLERIACSLAKEVIVVAPEVEQSAASHALTVPQAVTCQAFGSSSFRY